MVTALDNDDFVAAFRRGEAIEGHDLSGIEWNDLPDGRLVARDCVFEGARFAEAALEGAMFERCTFTGCKFGVASLSLAQFKHCTFFDTEEREGCDFFGTELAGALFERCNLSMCKFAGASLHNAKFVGCKAPGVSFEEARFARKVGRQSMTGGELTECNLEMASFRGVDLDDCSFEGSNLRSADFSRASLKGASLQRADLSEAVVSGASFENTDLRGASLSGFNLRQVTTYQGLKVSESEAGALVRGLGIRVFPG